MRILRDESPADGGGSSIPTTPIEAPSDAPSAAPPPAAATVASGGRTERELQLEKDLLDGRNELERERQRTKTLEVRASELERDVQTLKTPVKKKTQKIRAFGIHFD